MACCNDRRCRGSRAFLLSLYRCPAEIRSVFLVQDKDEPSSPKRKSTTRMWRVYVPGPCRIPIWLDPHLRTKPSANCRSRSPEKFITTRRAPLALKFAQEAHDSLKKSRLLIRFVKVPPPLSQLEQRDRSIAKDQRIIDAKAFVPNILRSQEPLARQMQNTKGSQARRSERPEDQRT